MTEKKAQERPLAAQLASALQKLVKKPFCLFDVGPSDSPFVDLHFGKKIERAEPLPYTREGDEVGHFEGEMSLYISCVWRLDSPDDVICGCWDDKSLDGQMRTGLGRLLGRTVRRVLTQPPAWDLTIELDEGWLLHVFCDQTNDEEGADNYSLFTKDHVYTVGTLSEVFVEARD